MPCRPGQPHFRPLLAAVLAVLAVTSLGCFGPFRVTGAVYDFNRTVGNKFLRSVAMIAMLIIPVYGIAALADILIFNVIEFWSGNPAIAQDRTLPDGTQVSFIRLSDDVLRVRATSPAGRVTEIDVVKVGARAGYVRLPGGAIVAQIEQAAGGTIVARRPDGTTLALPGPGPITATR